jgi:hypothetical protein
MRDAKASRPKRAMPIADEQISVVIDGRSIVEAYIKRQLPPDFSNLLPTGCTIVMQRQPSLTTIWRTTGKS